ncbi:unnamed protein product [Miscanthus lutarioriparius]|uniref:Uncharacterized protein n=1 Tax=Miscanthus lutarioriparius TaxID=422564 RepID=A0A811R762_9POAL|nr:unnamed protein product [Miscanthus lutarioriparius]
MWGNKGHTASQIHDQRQDRVTFFSSVLDGTRPTAVDAQPTRDRRPASPTLDDNESSELDGEEEEATPKHYPTRGGKQPVHKEPPKKKRKGTTTPPRKQGWVKIREPTTRPSGQSRDRRARDLWQAAQVQALCQGIRPLEEAPRASEDAAGPSDEDTQSSEPVNEGEPVVSPQASLSEMALGAPIGPRRSERQGPSREIPEGIEEIDWEPPRPWKAPPPAARTFLRRGDMLEVMEEEEASKQMKELQATLASASSQIQELMKTAEHRTCLLEQAAPAFAENKRLRESMEALERSLAGAHGDKEKLQSRVSELESKNWSLTEQLSTAVD